MAIAEDQLDVWAKLGPTGLLSETYNSIRSTLMDSRSPFYFRSFDDVYLQGSYGNNTNVRVDSDVDLVLCTSDTWHYDLDHLSADQRQKFQQDITDVTSVGPPFKQEVTGWLNSQYGAEIVDPQHKAIKLKGNDYRKPADILVCTEHRQYFSYNGNFDAGHHKGVRFFAPDGTSIVNFPKLHAEACTEKHQATNSQFKPTVRIFKNMRNRMIERGIIANGLAPSYYIECALWNVPNSTFSYYYNATVPNCLEWLRLSDRQKLLCANQRRWLLRNGRPDAWIPADFENFLAKAIKFWTDGG